MPKRLLVVLTCGAAATAGLVISGPASDASGLHHFKQAGACGTRESAEPADFLTAQVGAGRWKVEPGNRVKLVPFRKACVSDYLSENQIGWKPSMKRFDASYRWYVGKKVVKKTSGSVHNGAPYGPMGAGARSELKSKHLTYHHGHWSINGHRVSVRITLTKPGYQKATFKVTNFIDDLD
ncbi:MAG TPA: hypothetical protein VHW64_10140 [Nocardioides sp.]|jgi:hypothetical protein|uniref:hypothetical protein n=1 Tax=Nocardioides sp. TaxID=35761 RepID=UPI002E3800A1|nr:hypothetical protein [Nocardioides sp.]HEX3931056.1 hypothetical protein [Nocardioides sp.]